MTVDRRAVQARSFGAAAAAYDRGRPSYPEAAVHWCLPTNVRRVLDLGAGTGKLTEVLVRLGLDVVAVEPLAGMRAQLSENLPAVQVLDGTGEQIPLPDASVDAVLCAQAWHWVDPDRAAPEVARVLRPGGRLALLWNVRDADASGWSSALNDLLEKYDRLSATDDAVRVGPPFGEPVREDFGWSQSLTHAALVDMVVSRSYFITSSDQEKQDFLEELHKQVLGREDVRNRETLELPYRTECWLYHRPD